MVQKSKIPPHLGDLHEDIADLSSVASNSSTAMFCLPQVDHLWFLFCFVRALTKVLQPFLNEVRGAILLCPD